MTQTEALRLALEALESASNAIESWGSYASEYFQDKHDLQGDINNTQQAITAIKAALQAKDEPWEKFCDSHCVWTDHHPDCKLAKDEPVGTAGELFSNTALERLDLRPSTGIYIAPPPVAEPHKRPSRSDIKPLTDEQIFNVISSTTAGDMPYSYRIARAIEAAHGIKEKK